MKSVFVVQHEREDPVDYEDDVKFIGVYSTRAKADEIIARLKRLPGFVSFPEGFSVAEYELNEDHWTEGFVTVYFPKSGGETVGE